jgi:hypothetical protein
MVPKIQTGIEHPSWVQRTRSSPTLATLVVTRFTSPARSGFDGSCTVRRMPFWRTEKTCARFSGATGSLVGWGVGLTVGAGVRAVAAADGWAVAMGEADAPIVLTGRPVGSVACPDAGETDRGSVGATDPPGTTVDEHATARTAATPVAATAVAARCNVRIGPPCRPLCTLV